MDPEQRQAPALVVSSQSEADGRNYYTCSQCLRKFRGLESVNYHIQAHLVKRQLPYHCPDCPENFASGKLLGNHRREAHKKPSTGHLKHRRSVGDIRALAQNRRICQTCTESPHALRKAHGASKVTPSPVTKLPLPAPPRLSNFVFLLVIYAIFTFFVFAM
ncbi:hypothetical protein TCAL_14362 [Tigriopus californicus]|uniref:C2H2-type domain-containing protein n=1 Tax=Tigriopus californicus TaxID=6832 RepID=A0A553NE75_TIGCA|nr:hypothetical protein TCAL_14362 [Tigriopus californicus]